MTSGQSELTGRTTTWVFPTTFTLLFVVLNVLAFEAFAIRTLVILGAVIGGGALIYAILPKSIFLPLALTNGLILYPWLFSFFIRLNFDRATPEAIRSPRSPFPPRCRPASSPPGRVLPTKQPAPRA